MTITIKRGNFNIELAIKADDLIDGISSALEGYLQRGSPIKVVQKFVTSQEGGEASNAMTIKSRRDMDQWRNQTKEFMIGLKASDDFAEMNSVEIIIGDLEETFSIDRRSGEDRRKTEKTKELKAPMVPEKEALKQPERREKKDRRAMIEGRMEKQKKAENHRKKVLDKIRGQLKKRP